MRVTIYTPDLAALVFGINVIGISRIGKHPKPVAVVHVLPLRVSNAAGILGFAYKGTVVLQTSIHAVGVVIVHADVIKLRHRQVSRFPPFRAAVVGVPHPAIVAGEHDLCVGWIDPDVVDIAVHPAETAYYCETLAAILADDHRAVCLKHAVRIFWIDNQFREVERAPHHPLAFIALVPRGAAVVGNE